MAKGDIYGKDPAGATDKIYREAMSSLKEQKTNNANGSCTDSKYSKPQPGEGGDD